MVESANLPTDLDRLQALGVELLATVLAPDAEPLKACTRPRRFALLLGSEGHGLPAEIIAQCDRRITIPMHPGVDSLNVAVAAGIILHHFS